MSLVKQNFLNGAALKQSRRKPVISYPFSYLKIRTRNANKKRAVWKRPNFGVAFDAAISGVAFDVAIFGVAFDTKILA